MEVTNETNPDDIFLYDYLRLAKRCIVKFAYGKIRAQMIKDDDAITFVAEAIINSMYSTKWNKNKGASRKTYVIRAVKWAILKWSISMNRQPPSYFANIDSIKKPKLPDEILIQQELNNIIYLLINKKLTDRQRQCICLVYLDGHNFTSAAKLLGVSRQAVQQCTRTALNKLHKYKKNLT